MITFKMFGFTYEIQDDDWKIIRDRFNLDNAIKTGAKTGAEWRIPTSCSLCDRYDSNCSTCPMQVTGDKGCSWFFNKLFQIKRFGTGRYSVSWSKECNAIARKQLKRLNQIMDKIETDNIKEAKCKKKKKKKLN